MNDVVRISGREDSTIVPLLLPRRLLAWHSSSFAAALGREEFARNRDEEMQINDNVDAFQAFGCWIYTGRLQDPPASSFVVGDTGLVPDDLYPSRFRLREIWVFGDTRGIPGIKNAAIDKLHEKYTVDWAVTDFSPAMRYAYENTSKIRSCVRFSWTCTPEPWTSKPFEKWTETAYWSIS